MPRSLTRANGRLIAALALGTAALTALTACGAKSEAPADAAGANGVKAGAATSVADFGGMKDLVAAAEKEGTLNAIALPPDWANYGEIIKAFEAKYKDQDQGRDPRRRQRRRDQRGQVPQGPGPRARRPRPRHPLRAQRRRGRPLRARTRSRPSTRSPRPRRTPKGALVQRLRRLHLHRLRRQAHQGLPARPSPTCSSPSTRARSPSTATRPSPVRPSAGCTRRPSPTRARFDDIQPGIDFFGKLKKSGNFIPVESTPATVEKGETPDQHRLGLPQRRLRRASSRARASTGRSPSRPTATTPSTTRRPSTRTPRTRPPPACGGVPLQPRGPEPLAQGLRPPRAAARDDHGRHGRQEPRRQAARRSTGTPAFPEPPTIDKAKAVLAENWDKAVS